MVGVYCAFLSLDKKAMRRSENMSVLTVIPKQADLTEVMSLITGQLKELAKGITVMDVRKATPAHLFNSVDAVPVIVDERKLNVPFTQSYPRVACILGDAVSQAVIGGGRPTNSGQFCRCCHCNQGTVNKKSMVYDVRSELLLHNLCKFSSHITPFCCTFLISANIQKI